MGRALFPELRISAERGARLLPESEAAWWGLLRALSQAHRRDVNPLIDRALPVPIPALSRPGEGPQGERSDLPEPHVPYLGPPGEPLRALAAIDLGDLGADCVALRFSRRRGDYEAPGLVRVRVGDWAAERLPAEGLSTVDRACPARGLYVYAVTAADPAEYSLEVFSLEAPEGARAEPSSYDGALEEPAAVRAARELCEAGQEQGCLTLGRYLELAAGPPP